jgi:RNA polymerase sigma-70 factor (sigma-E family)
LCGDWHLAEDLAQDTLTRMYAVWPRVSRSGVPDAYSRRTLINAHRAAARRPWRRESAVDVLEDTDAAAVRDESTSVTDRDALLHALSKLGRSQRTIVVLRYWEDLSVAEVADLLDLSAGAVKSQAARGLAHLRAALPAPTAATEGAQP